MECLPMTHIHNGECSDRLRGTKNKHHSNWNFGILADQNTIGESAKRLIGINPGQFTVVGLVLVILVGMVQSGTAFSSNCVADQCAVDFMRALDHDKVLIGPNLPYCTLLKNYGSCLNRTSRACRGDLKYHSLYTMISTQIRDHKCSTLIENGRKLGLGKTGDTEWVKWNGTEDSVTSNGGRCLFPYQHQKGSGGYRYCSMFGDPHLRTFHGQYETCKTLGAWPLLDNSYFGVQVTNDPVADGVAASGISKVTVIIKALPGCSDQKMYESSRDYLSSTFVDGTWNSGDPTTNSVSGASYTDEYLNNGDKRPAALIRTIEPDRHVEINLRYISTRIVIRRVGGFLTVAIKIPEEVVFQRTSLNSLQVCLTGCPSSERINYKQLLAHPDYYVGKWASMNRDRAVEICKRTGVTDFFFDSCVFDLLMTGDESFKESALSAMNDIRQLYPPYRKHYETGRADLTIYQELGKMGQELLDSTELERGHKRRQPIFNEDYADEDQKGQETIRTSGQCTNAPFIKLLFFFWVLLVFLLRRR